MSRRRILEGGGSADDFCCRDETSGFRSLSDMIDALRTCAIGAGGGT